ARRIRRLQALRAVAQRVEVIVADLDTHDGARRAVADAAAAFGRLDGIVHAAGRLHDELIETLDTHTARSVVAPKADASLALAEAAVTESVSRLVLVSSSSTELAPIGQLAYIGANAVLDAMAGERDGVEITTVGFGLWADVGMASDAGARMRLGLGAGERFDHPVVSEIHRHDDRVELVGRLDAHGSWVVDEHRTIEGVAVLPGTGHLDLMLTAAKAAEAPGALADVELFGPVVVGDDPVWIRAVVEHGDDPHVRVESDLGGGAWSMHSSARLVDPAPAPALVAPDGDRSAIDLFAEQRSTLTVGPRWDAAASLVAADGTAAATITTTSAAGEGEAWMLHPALADLATAVGVSLRLGIGLHVPTGYESVVSIAPLADRIEVIAHRRSHSTDAELLVDLDMRVDDAVVAQIRGLRLLALEPSALTPPEHGRRRATDGGLVAIADEVGLRPHEGTELLARLIGSDHRYGLISSVDLEVLRALDTDDDVTDPDAPVAATLEDELVAIYADLLGVDDIDTEADFFDLGGHSLLAIRLTGRIQSALGVRVQIAALADASSVTRLAALLRELQPGIDATFAARFSGSGDAIATSSTDTAPTEADAAAWRSLVPISREGDGRPLYVVHGAGGNVLFLWSLARGMAGDRPVYGFQAKGSEGGLMPDPTLEAMAARYVDELVAHDDGPYLLGGFSGGGLIALEMSRILAARGKTTDLVVLFDTPTPGNLRPSFLRRWRNVVRTASDEGLGAVRSHVKTVVSYWVRRVLPRDAARQAQREQNERELGYVVDGQVADLYFHFTSTADRYVPSRYGSKVALIRADDVRPTQRADYGWGKYLDQSISLSTSPGDHHTMFYPENAGVLADRVRDAIDLVDPA
ncbi:MAG: SDR family NAD(P)-dependent oxidoreductase, partial [Actinomycetota bacterium]